MKKILTSTLILSLTGIIIFISCTKEKSCEGCRDGNKPPTAVAGPDQVITLPTDSILLDGSASSDPDGTISEWLWTKIEGPASFHIVTTSSPKTVVKDLDTGIYRFELTIKDNVGLSARDTMQVIVSTTTPVNSPPVANAGNDTIITLPANSALLDGSHSSDPDNNITVYLWTKISGPLSFNIANPNMVQTEVINPVEGTYQFELKVTDAGGLFSKDTVQVIVNSIPILCEPLNRPIISAQLIPVGNLSIGRYNMATVSAGNKVFFAGGFISGTGMTSRVDIYDITSQTWSTAELSIPRLFLSAVAAGDKVFFAGGSSATGATSRVDIYNFTTQSWSIAELSQARHSIETATIGNKVFFAGGEGSARVDIYDITADTWSTDYLSEARIGFTATAADNKIYFAGGEPQGGVGYASNKIDIYNNATDSWSSSVLNAPKKYHAAIFRDGKIFWAGGITYTSIAAGNEDSITCQVEIKDVNTQVSSFANLSEPTLYNEAFEKDNKIVIISTYSGWGGWQQFDIYDLASGSWSIGHLAQSISSYASIISVNNSIYIAGGLSSSAGNLESLTQVWKLEF